MRVGNSDIQFTAGSATDWLHLLPFAAMCAVPSMIIGAIAGFVFRGRIVLQFTASAIGSFALFALAAWRFANPGEWSADNMPYMLGGYNLFFGGPSLLATLVVVLLHARHKTI